MIYTLDAIAVTAQKVLEHSKSKILCLYGEMGAGKTTLTKAVIASLGSSSAVSSPTFGLVNEYHSDAGELLGYHFDFYRINDETEALDLGFEDYLNKEVWVFIEWPEKIPSFIPENATNIHIDILDEKTRELTITSS